MWTLFLYIVIEHASYVMQIFTRNHVTVTESFTLINRTLRERYKYGTFSFLIYTAREVFVFGIFLARIFLHANCTRGHAGYLSVFLHIQSEFGKIRTR